MPRVEGIRDAYADALSRRSSTASQPSATAAGWGFGTHRTDHAPEAALLALYTALADSPAVTPVTPAVRSGLRA